MPSPGMPQPAGKTAATATGQIKTGAGYYYGYIVTTVIGATGVTIYDNTSAAGTVIEVIPALTAAGTKAILPLPIPIATGILAAFGSTGTVLFVYD